MYLPNEKNKKTPYNSTYKKLAVQWLNKALCFVSSFVVVDSFVLRNRQLLVAANRYRQGDYTMDKKSAVIFFIGLFTFGCSGRQDNLDYSEIVDKDKNVVCKINPTDSSSIIYLDNTYMIGKLLNMNREGLWTEYSQDDNEPVFKWTYKEDKRNGIYYGYTATGKIWTLGYFKNDALDSFLLYFDLSGRPEKIEYWHGFENGTSILDTTIDFRHTPSL